MNAAQCQPSLDAETPSEGPSPDDTGGLLNARPSANWRPGQRGGFRERKSVDHTLRHGIASMLRSVVRRADFDLPDLHTLAELANDLEHAQRDAVDNLRAQGHSWAAIARELGTTRQAAQQRFGS